MELTREGSRRTNSFQTNDKTKKKTRNQPNQWDEPEKDQWDEQALIKRMTKQKTGGSKLEQPNQWERWSRGREKQLVKKKINETRKVNKNRRTTIAGGEKQIVKKKINERRKVNKNRRTTVARGEKQKETIL